MLFCWAFYRAASRDLSSREQKLMALPMHGSLPSSHQMKVFQRTPSDTRKVVLATNIAEASITINGIVYGMYANSDSWLYFKLLELII